MRLYVCLGILLTGGMSSIASAGDDRCGEDVLSLAEGQGRNAWAASCGYLQPSAVPSLDANHLYVVFTMGCGHAGCSPYVPVVATDPCVSGLTTFEYCTHNDAVLLTLSSDESGITVSSAGRVERCPDGGTCSFSYFLGSPLTLTLTSTRNLVDCLQFTGWQGACAGQGSTCSLVANSDLSTTATWSRIIGCIPR